jgi:CRP-like cAMP-binding protein
MTGPVTAAELGRFSLFRGLPDEDRVALAAVAERRDLADGANLYAEGGPALELYLVERGQVTLRVFREGHTIIVGTFGPNEPLGWSCLREDPVALTTARASGPLRLIAIPAEPLLALMSSGSAVGRTLVQRFLNVAALNLAVTREQIVRHGREGVITGG